MGLNIRCPSPRLSLYRSAFIFILMNICISPFPTFIFQFLVENLVQVQGNQQMTGGELVKELRWHYKQYMTARQKKEKLANVSVFSRKVEGKLIFLHKLN